MNLLIVTLKSVNNDDYPKDNIIIIRVNTLKFPLPKRRIGTADRREQRARRRSIGTNELEEGVGHIEEISIYTSSHGADLC